jgi:hypothetical protein
MSTENLTIRDAVLIRYCLDPKCESPRAALRRVRPYWPELTLEQVQETWWSIRNPLTISEGVWNVKRNSRKRNSAKDYDTKPNRARHVP